MKLTRRGFRSIIVAPLLLAAGVLWIVLDLPVYNGLSLIGTAVILFLISLAIYNFGWYRIEHPRHTPRHAGQGWREADPDHEPRHAVSA